MGTSKRGVTLAGTSSAGIHPTDTKKVVMNMTVVNMTKGVVESLVVMTTGGKETTTASVT